MVTTKVLVIGLDGATWDLIKPWVDKGELPTFGKLMDVGVWGELESTIPPWTFPAWDAMCTGKNPGRLPMFTFMVKDGYRFEPYILKSKPPQRFFDVLAKNGKRILLANLPNINCAYETNGTIVAGWFCTNEKELTYPSDLLLELDSVLKEKYTVDMVGIRKGERFWKPKRGKNGFLKQVDALLDLSTAAFSHLLGNKPWGFGFVVLVTTDRIQHRCWDERILLRHYKRLDLKLRGLLDSVGDDVIVFLVSDHGFGPVEFTFNVNEWLMREGYLQLDAGSKRNHMLPFIANLLQKARLIGPAQVLLGLLPLPTVLSQAVTSSARRSLPRGFDALEIDWKKTTAFAYGVFGDIYLNLEGREPSGTLKRTEYDRIRDELIHKLENLKHPSTGKKLAVEVFRKDEVYKNSSVDDNKPDLVMLPTDDGVQAFSPLIGTGQIFTKSEGGNHRLKGLFLAKGPHIKGGQKVSDAKIYDIAPTILHMFGLPIPRDMDGRVLREIFEEGSELAGRAITYEESEAKDEKERLRARIKGLKASDKT